MQKIILFFLLLYSLNGFSQENKTVWEGTASYYHPKFNGKKTASGEVFKNETLSGANNFLPLGTTVKVTNLKNKKFVYVTINDRLSKKNKRLIDLSVLAAKQLNFYHQGLCKVRIELMDESKTQQKKSRLRKKDGNH